MVSLTRSALRGVTPARSASWGLIAGLVIAWLLERSDFAPAIHLQELTRSCGSAARIIRDEVQHTAQAHEQARLVDLE
jgi:hypothetical protein